VSAPILEGVDEPNPHHARFVATEAHRQFGQALGRHAIGGLTPAEAVDEGHRLKIEPTMGGDLRQLAIAHRVDKPKDVLTLLAERDRNRTGRAGAPSVIPPTSSFA
jgi:hypothetical protein